MNKRAIVAVVILLVLAGAAGGWLYLRSRPGAAGGGPPGRPPVTVTAVEASTQVWEPTVTAVGTVTAVNGVEVSPELAGVVREIHFDSGDRVAQGDSLLQLDDDTDRAQLRATRADAELARIELERDEELIEIRAISQNELDQARSTLESTLAREQELEAIIAKKLVRAPFAGKLGIRRVDLGQFIEPGEEIVTLQALDPLYVDFTLPQRLLSQVRLGQEVSVATDAFSDQTLRGKIAAIDPRVDPATRNFKLRATLRNEGERLLPGMYVDVQVHSATRNEWITLPQTAVTYNPYGDSVYLVREGPPDQTGAPALTVTRVFVRTGDKRGDQVAVLEGVKAGDRVVTSGQMKLREGTPVRIDNRITPSDDPAPRPTQP